MTGASGSCHWQQCTKHPEVFNTPYRCAQGITCCWTVPGHQRWSAVGQVGLQMPCGWVSVSVSWWPQAVVPSSLAQHLRGSGHCLGGQGGGHWAPGWTGVVCVGRAGVCAWPWPAQGIMGGAGWGRGPEHLTGAGTGPGGWQSTLRCVLPSFSGPTASRGACRPPTPSQGGSGGGAWPLSCWHVECAPGSTGLSGGTTGGPTRWGPWIRSVVGWCHCRCGDGLCLAGG